MKLNGPIALKRESFGRRFGHDQRGQTMVIVSIALVCVLAAAALSVDVGNLYYAYQELQAGTQAAALAGASVLSNDTSSEAIATATQYSAANGDLNARFNLTNVTMTASVKCLSSTGIVCSASPADANAIVVTEQAVVPTTFARVVGVDSWTISATATAGARGGSNDPHNVVIILDTTHSMNDTDSDSQCDNTRISCALAGVRTLLGTLWPCAGGLMDCGSATSETATIGANVSNPTDEVGLMVFPGLTSTAEVPDDYTCPTTNPSITSYNNGPVYQIIALSSDYRTSDTSSLNVNSDMVIATGGGGCSGVAAPGGEGTFYAGVIDAAQAQLVANARPNTKNVMILLSDGDANATATQMAGTATSYPSTQECQQAVRSAQNAAAAGTIVYSVAYGAEASGCPTDTNPTITPCETMQQIASSPENFFSDYTATGGASSCVSAARPTSSLNEIFNEIAQDLTVARLLPNNTQ